LLRTQSAVVEKTSNTVNDFSTTLAAENPAEAGVSEATLTPTEVATAAGKKTANF
jgi:hypothetical protein